MEEEEHSSEVTNSSPVVDSPTSPKDLNEDDLVSLDKTIQIENSSLKAAPIEHVEAANPIPENTENRRKKVKEEKPHSKIVVRRLPPTMTKESFMEQVSPLPEVDYMYYIQGDSNNGINPFSRAYLNFVSQEDLFSFSRTFDNYVFLDAKGQEYHAVVEFAMFQRVPKQRPKKKDPLMGTIESDPTFITFKENLLAEALENSKTGGKAVKQHFFETEISTAEEVNTTPLLEFLKVRRAEKARMREERREEKKRKELERKLKQKTKDKKGEGDEEEPPKDSKVQTKDKRENKERESRSAKKKDEKERGIKETRAREFKSRGGKSYQEERLRLAERREEQKKRELLNSGEKKQDNAEPAETDTSEVAGEQAKVPEEKTSKFEKKKYEYRKKYDDEWKDDKKRNNKNNVKRDGRDRKDDYRRNQDKKVNESDMRRKVKNYKSSDFSKNNEERKKSSMAVHEQIEGKEENAKNKKDNEISKDKWRSVDDLVLISTVERKKSDNILTESNEASIGTKKRHSSLENLRFEEKVPEAPPKKVTLLQREKPEPKETNKDNSSNYRSRKDVSSNKSSSESKTYSNKRKDRFYDKHDEGKETNAPSSKSRSHDTQGDSTKSKDAPRSDRRIRNKDRPSIEIYRPGMGKFSKQRLEKEKALGSSTEVDSPSHSPSPTPKTKIVT